MGETVEAESELKKGQGGPRIPSPLSVSVLLPPPPPPLEIKVPFFFSDKFKMLRLGAFNGLHFGRYTRQWLCGILGNPVYLCLQLTSGELMTASAGWDFGLIFLLFLRYGFCWFSVKWVLKRMRKQRRKIRALGELSFCNYELKNADTFSWNTVCLHNSCIKLITCLSCSDHLLIMIDFFRARIGSCVHIILTCKHVLAL